MSLEMDSAQDTDKFLLLGCWRAPRKPTLLMIGTPIPAGRKTRHLVMVSKPWRSKYMQAECMGTGKKCRAGTCPHASSVAAFFRRCRPVSRADNTPQGKGEAR